MYHWAFSPSRLGFHTWCICRWIPATCLGSPSPLRQEHWNLRESRSDLSVSFLVSDDVFEFGLTTTQPRLLTGSSRTTHHIPYGQTGLVLVGDLNISRTIYFNSCCAAKALKAGNADKGAMKRVKKKNITQHLQQRKETKVKCCKKLSEKRSMWL